jgi:type 1 glutamine amidotransferase
MNNRALGVLFGVALAGLAGSGLAGSALTGAQRPGGGSGQAPAPAAGAGGGQRGAVAAALFTVSDADKDGALTRAELKAILDKWSAQWEAGQAGAAAQAGGLGQEQLVTGLSEALPLQPPAGGGGGGARGPQNQVPNQADVDAMMAALPAKAPVRPRQPRKVLVLGKAAGFVHSSIPLAARTIQELGQKTGAWSTTVTYDPADINEQNLRQYDAIFLDSTTGEFLDDANDAAATAARRKALLDFVRGGKGLAGIHAATDSYHQNAPAPDAAAATRTSPGRGAVRGMVASLATLCVTDGDRNKDQRVSRDEMGALADTWFDRIDPAKSGRVSQSEFPQRFAAMFPPPRLGPTGFPIQPPATERGPDRQVGTWPEFNRMIGGFFKFHWNDGQLIHVKVDDPDHPLNAPFKGKPQLQIVDETYTFGRDTYSRQNVRVLTSVDYAKMSDEDKAKEQYPRPDGDYALSWIRREGKGRIFYEAHGHNEKIYAITPLLEHVLLGMQYVLGDLEADDRPTAKPGSHND